jgi:hypothetical protein
VAQAVDQAQQQRDLTKEAIEADLDRLERRIRAELDWKARLRRDAPQIVAVVGGFLVIAVGAIVLRRVLRGDDDEDIDLAEEAVVTAVSLQDLAVELRELREELGRTRAKRGGRPLWQTLAVAAVTAAASAGGRTAAKRLVEQGAERDAAPSR